MVSELGPDAVVLVCLSGRGDKDMGTAAAWFELVDKEALLDPLGVLDDEKQA